MSKPKADSAALVVNEEFIEIISKLLEFFKGDIKKTRAWLTTKNPGFGFIAPLQLIVRNRGIRVLQFIDNAKEENTPPGGWPIPREWYFSYAPILNAWERYDDKPEGESIKVREIIEEKINDSDVKTEKDC